MKRSLGARGALVAVSAGIVALSGCGGGGSTAASGSGNSGSGNKSSICNQFKTVASQLNADTGPTANSTAVSQLNAAQSKVQALASQSSDSQLSSDLTSLANLLGKFASDIKSNNSGAGNSDNAAGDKALKALSKDCSMNFNTGSSGSSSNSSGSSGTTTSTP